MLDSLINGIDIEQEIRNALYEIHVNGPSDPIIFEKLAYIKRFHSELFKHYENRILSAMGLFYKTGEPQSILEEVYQIFSRTIVDETGQVFTPAQASAYKEIRENRYFSFSAPTSSGKSYLFRELILKTQGDIVIVVPSRALISEYYYEVLQLVDSTTLVLQYIDNINTANISRRVYIVTPERAAELFKYEKEFNLELILLDEAQIAEEPVRGMTFDAFVRRSDRAFPYAKKIFAHPFVDNPEAQLEKHGFKNKSSSRCFNLNAVGKIFLSTQDGAFEYFSPNVECKHVPLKIDIAHDILRKGGTLLVYMSKSKIYDGGYLVDFSKYIDLCEKITAPKAVALIEELRTFIGASRGASDKHSTLIDLLEKGIVIHHGSMPLRARLLVEEFVKQRYARMCFATSTLNQGINMPFDVVWIDNFNRMDVLTLKNLIGRSGRTTPSGYFDYGFTVIKRENVATFKTRFNQAINLRPTSSLDNELSDVHEDYKDLVEAVRSDSYNTELHLTNSQVERIEKADVDTDIQYILDNLLVEDKPITGKAYYALSEASRKKIKECIKTIYVQHLRRKTLSKAEASVLSAAIPIMLWHVQGKSFSEIVSLRHAFLSEKDIRREIISALKAGKISASEAKQKIRDLPIRYSPIPAPLPNSDLKSAPLFPQGMSADEIDYDIIVYDTYDYLDKVISLSLVDPLCASLEMYFIKHKDYRAEALKNYIRFGTNENLEMWLLRYGFGYEEILWIKEHVETIDSTKILFKKTVSDLSEAQLTVISRYL